MNNLAENLKRIRKENNLSQEELASILKVSRQAISKWESNLAYPEMDKLMQICKQFNVKLDDLLNQDISEVKKEEESKKSINKYLDSFLSFITDTINVFSHLSFKNKIKCIFEQLIIIGISCILFSILTYILKIISSPIIDVIPYKVIDLFLGIYILCAFIITLIILANNFKLRYIDYIKSSNIDKKKIQLKEEKIVIRDTENSKYHFIEGIFKIFIFFIKFFCLLILLFFSIILITLITFFIITFLIIKTNIFFIGTSLSILSLSTICIIIILLLLNFIFNRKIKKSKIIITFITSLVTLGIGIGLIFIGSLQFSLINNKTKSSIHIPMQDNLTITDYYDNITYIEKDIEDIQIEYEINEVFDIDYFINNDNDLDIIIFYIEEPDIFKITKLFIKELNKKNVLSINNDINLTIYASKDNLTKLKNNKQKYYEYDYCN